MKKFASGELRHRVTIQALTFEYDSAGEPVQDQETGETPKAWQDIATVWAAIEPLRVGEFIAAAATQSKLTAKLTIRYRTDIDAGMRVIHEARLFNIEGVMPDAESGREFLVLPCSDGVSVTGE